MAIAFVAKGTTAKVDTTVSGPNVVVSLPAGHVSGHLLLMFVTTDDNTNTVSDPSGWTRLFYITNGSSVGTPYTPRLRTKCYYRIDNGSLGASVTLNFSTSSPWPTANPSVLAYCVAYSGCDTTGPIERWDFTSTTSTATAEAHPQVTTTTANAWLLSFRGVSSDSPGATFTCSVGTDAERQDDVDSINELSCALYDSNAALAAGLQTQRTTTASRAATYGSLAASIVIKPSGAASSTPSAGSAEAIASALNATVTAQNGPWSLCGTGGLPRYTFAIDWAGDGVSTTGRLLNSNPFVRDDLTDWSVVNATMARTLGIISDRVPVLQLTSTAGASPRVQDAHRAVTAGNSYRARGWLYIPATVPTTSELNINWFDVSHNYLSTSANTATLTPGTWVQYDQTYTAPVGAAYASVLISFGASPGAGYVLYGYGIMLIDPGATSELVIPSPGDDVTQKITSDISLAYGRDQTRQLNPAAVGSASFSVINVDRLFSPEFTTSLLYGDLEPAQRAVAAVDYGGNTFPLMYSKIDDYNIKADMTDRTVDFTFLDGLADLQNIQLSTEVYKARRTGELIGIILDLAGWTGPRDLDLGATLVPYWWVEGTDALTAITDLIKSEGPPSIAYQAPNGTFVFYDRHHRIQRAESTAIQATFDQSTLMSCTSTALPNLDFTAPFIYAHGWRDIINSVTFDVSDRIEDADLTVVWSQDTQISLSTGESTTVEVSGNDPFLDAVVPVSGTDFTASGAGVPSVSLSRTSGASATITILAIGGAVTLTGLQLRARTISVQRNIKVSRVDADSITRHGEKAYPDPAPWANANDADAIAGMILLHYARRRPTVQMRITSQDPAHLVQCLSRTVSDRIHIRYDEMGLDDDFFVESVQHTIQRINVSGQPPVHSVVLGCEKDLEVSLNPFTFDKRGAGFDDGTFDPIQSDQADTVFVFDHPVQGQFDGGLFGT
jgi:hypothetical protein